MTRKHRRIEQTGTRRGLKCNLYRACVDVEMYTARYRVVFLKGMEKATHVKVRYPNVNLIILRAKKYTKRQRKRHHASACVSCGR